MVHPFSTISFTSIFNDCIMKPYRHFLLFIMLAAVMASLASCSASKEAGGAIQWNIQFRQDAAPVMSKCPPFDQVLSIWTSSRPILIPATETTDERIRIIEECADGEPVTYDVPRSRIDTILYATSPRDTAIPLVDYGALLSTCRQRTGFGPFDKLELRILFGYRGGPDSVFYPSAAGGRLLVSDDFLSFDTAGSSFFLKAEIAAFWGFDWLDPTQRLQLGIMTGLWPIDGSLFIPAGLRVRYTANQGLTLTESDNTWYVYGDLGLPLDFQTEAPIFGRDAEHQRYFYGAGFGYDWAVTCDWDFGVDLGVRRFNLPLPPIDCCPDVDNELRHAFRLSTGIYARFGITF
jgi:hypothetical protein